MTRVMPVVFVTLACALLCVPVSAEDPPKKLTAEERKDLEAKWEELNAAGIKAFEAGKTAEATTAWAEALKVAQRLYPKAEFPDGHHNLAVSLSNLASLYTFQNKYADAEPLYKAALEMNRRVSKEDSPTFATSILNLGHLYWVQGRYADAEPLFKEALEMTRRLYKGDHALIATCLNNLAYVNFYQGRYAEAEPLYKGALEMRRRLFTGDHHALAASLSNLAQLYKAQGKYAEAEPLLKEALEMYKRLFKGDHPNVAQTLNGLGALYRSRGTPPRRNHSSRRRWRCASASSRVITHSSRTT